MGGAGGRYSIICGLNTPPRQNKDPYKSQSKYSPASQKGVLVMGKKTISDEKKVVIKSLVDAGKSYREVQEIIPVSLGYIGKIIKEFEASKELVEWYKENKADILSKAQLDSTVLQEAIRHSITEEDIKKWTPDQKARWHQALTIEHGTKFDKERLQRDESTENVSVIYKHILEMQKRDEQKREKEQLEE